MPEEGVPQHIEQLASLYRDEVLTAPRTRRIRLLGRKCNPQILYTFLGFELKLGRRRVHCPDTTTARYLRIFGEIGMAAVELPYDPTHTARLLPGLEEALTRIKELLLEEGLDEPRHRRRLRDVYAQLRRRLAQSEADSNQSRVSLHTDT